MICRIIAGYYLYKLNKRIPAFLLSLFIKYFVMKKKFLNKTSISILSAVAIIIVGGIVLKVIADSQSRVDY